MAIEAERLEVVISASGGKAAAREIRGVGTSAVEAGRGVSRLGGKLGDLARDFVSVGGASSVLKNRLDAVDDEIDEVGNSAATTSLKLQVLSGSAGAASAASSTLGTVMMATAIPAAIAWASVLGPLTATVGALTAGLAGLTAGFGAVIGTGVLGYGRKLVSQNKKQLKQVETKISALEKLKKKNGSLTSAQAKQLQKLKKQKKELKGATTVTGALGRKMKELGGEVVKATRPLQKKFMPLIADAVEAFPTLVRRIVAALGPLDSFAGELRRLGNAAMTVIPKIVRWITDMGRTAIPVFRRFTKVVGAEVPKAMKFLEGVVSETWDEFGMLASAATTLLGDLTRLGVTATSVLIPSLSRTIEKAGSLYEKFAALDKGLQKQIIRYTTLAPAVALVGSKLLGLVGPLSVLGGKLGLTTTAVSTFVAGLGTLGTILSGGLLAAVVGFAAAYQTNFAGVRKVTNQVVGVLRNELLKTFRVLVAEARPIIRDLRKEFGLFGVSTESSLRPVVRLVGTVLVDAIRTAGRVTRSVLSGMSEAYFSLKGAVGPTLAFLARETRRASRQMKSALVALRPTLKAIAAWTRTASKQIGKALRAVGPFLASFTRDVKQTRTSVASDVRSLRPYFDALRNFVGAAVDTAVGALRTLARVGGTALRAFMAVVRPVFNSFKRIASVVFPDVKAVATLALKGLVAATRKYLGFVDSVWRSVILPLANFTGKKFNQIRKVVAGALKWIYANGVKPTLSSIYTLWRKNLRGITTEVIETYKHIRSVILDALSFLKNSVVKPILGWIRRFWSKWGDDILRFTRGTFNGIKTVTNAVLSTLKTLWSRYGSNILDIARSMWNTIRVVIETVLDTVATVIKTTLNIIQGDWGEAWDNITSYVKRMGGRIESFLGSWGNTLGKLFGKIISDIIGHFKDLYHRLIGGSIVPDLFRDISSYVRNTGKRLVSGAVRAVKRGVLGVFDAIKDGAKDRVRSLISDAIGIVKDGARRIKSAFNSAIPDKVTLKGGFNIPSVTVGGGKIAGQKIPSTTIGGGRFGVNESLNLPQLDTGGMIEGDGLAMLHAGERVLNPAEVDRSKAGSGVGGGDVEINVYAPHADGNEVRRALADELRSHNFN